MATIISRRYEVLGQLGQGGMGVVYKVRHTVLETILALKVLPAYLMENPDIVARFTREARVVARLHHPNIVRVLDIESDADLNFYYFVMEYIEGETLDQYVRKKGPLPLPEIVEIGKQIASALEYAHNYHPSIVHRDIKPANIMIEAHSNRVVVMDFGIAKELGDTDGTKTGAVIGTLKYASPEQLRHEPLEGSSDVYSFGMVLYEMFTGKQFFAGLDEIAVLGKVLDNAQDNEPRFDRPAPAPFVNLVTKAIAKTRTQRYQRMADLLRALETCQAQERTERQVERGHVEEGKQRVTNAKGVAAALAPRRVPPQWQEVQWQETKEEQVWQAGVYARAGELDEQAGQISDRARVEAASSPKTVLSPPRRTTRQSVIGKWAGWAAMVLGTVMVSAIVIWFVAVREKSSLSISPPEGNVPPPSATTPVSSTPNPAPTELPPTLWPPVPEKNQSPPRVTRPDVTQSLLLGQFFQDRGQYEEALRELEEAKGRDPDNADILTALQRVRSAKEAEDKLNRSP